MRFKERSLLKTKLKQNNDSNNYYIQKIVVNTPSTFNQIIRDLNHIEY